MNPQKLHMAHNILRRLDNLSTNPVLEKRKSRHLPPTKFRFTSGNIYPYIDQKILKKKHLQHVAPNFTTNVNQVQRTIQFLKNMAKVRHPVPPEEIFNIWNTLNKLSQLAPQDSTEFQYAEQVRLLAFELWALIRKESSNPEIFDEKLLQISLSMHSSHALGLVAVYFSQDLTLMRAQLLADAYGLLKGRDRRRIWAILKMGDFLPFLDTAKPAAQMIVEVEEAAQVFQPHNSNPADLVTIL